MLSCTNYELRLLLSNATKTGTSFDVLALLLCMVLHVLIVRFQNLRFKDFSRTIRGIFKKTTFTQNGNFMSRSKQVQSKFDILSLSSINENWSRQKYLPNASDVLAVDNESNYTGWLHCKSLVHARVLENQIQGRSSSVNGIPMGMVKIRPPQNPNPSTDHDKTLHNWLRPWDKLVTQISHKSAVRECLAKYVKYKANCPTH